MVPAVAPADHARPARISAVYVYLQRASSATAGARPDSLRRVAVVFEFRDVADDQVRNARSVDARLRGHVVSRLSGFHVVEPQRNDPYVRDLRQRRREYDETQGHPAGPVGRSGPGFARPD